jgi:chromosome segregation ATPase
MSGFFKKALSVFVEFDENAEKDNSKSESTSDTTNNYNPIPSKVSFNKDDLDKFVKHFESLLEKANLPGPDYFEFIKTLEVLENHLTDEKVRITAAYASLNAQGLTKDKLVNSAQIYKSIIEKDKSDFESAVNDKIRLEIEARKLEQKNLSRQIKDASETISKLTEEIKQNQEKLADLENLIKDNNNKIKSNMDNYQYACSAILKKINDDISKINSLI